MERELGLLEQHGRRPIEQHPEEPEQPERPVGELLLGLPACVWSPVLVETSQVWNPARITSELELLELRDGHAQRFLDPEFSTTEWK